MTKVATETVARLLSYQRLFTVRDSFVDADGRYHIIAVGPRGHEFSIKVPLVAGHTVCDVVYGYEVAGGEAQAFVSATKGRKRIVNGLRLLAFLQSLAADRIPVITSPQEASRIMDAISRGAWDALG